MIVGDEGDGHQRKDRQGRQCRMERVVGSKHEAKDDAGGHREGVKDPTHADDVGGVDMRVAGDICEDEEPKRGHGGLRGAHEGDHKHIRGALNLRGHENGR